MLRKEDGLPLQIDLWPIDIESVDLERADAVLSEQEKERAAGYTDPTAQQVFMACRGELRRVLSIYLDMAPSVIPIEIALSGKPYIGADTDVRFNLSHAGGLGVIAVTTDAEVGVDVQPHDPDRPILEIAKRFFTGREFDHLESLEQDEQESAFYTLWSRKEALVKAVGSSLGSALTGLEVLGSEASSWTLVELSKRGEDHKRVFATSDVVVPAGFSGAVGVEINRTSPAGRTGAGGIIEVCWRTLSQS